MNEQFDKLRGLLAGVSGDKEEVESGDWGLTLLGLGLLVFTAFRTWDWLTRTLPEEWKILGVVGLLAFDVGTVVWAHIYLNKAISDQQRLIAKIMFFVDLGGVALTSLGDSSYRSQAGFLPADLTVLVSWIVPIVVILNLAAYYLYKFADPKAEARRQQRMRMQGIAASRGQYEAGRKELGTLEQIANLRLDLEAKLQALSASLGAKDKIDAAAASEHQRVMDDFQHRFNVPLEQANAPRVAERSAPAPTITPAELAELFRRFGTATQPAASGTNGHVPAAAENGDGDAKK